jgi:hypothetical protein
MGSVNLSILNYRCRRTPRIHRRHISSNLQTNLSRTSTIHTPTTIWTTTSKLLSNSTTTNHKNMPQLWKSSARKLAFLPQLRKTTKLANKNQRAFWAFCKLDVFQFFKKEKEKFRFFLLQLLFPMRQHLEVSCPSRTRLVRRLRCLCNRCF